MKSESVKKLLIRLSNALGRVLHISKTNIHGSMTSLGEKGCTYRNLCIWNALPHQIEVGLLLEMKARLEI